VNLALLDINQHDEAFQNSYPLLNIIQVIKLQRTGCAGYVPCVGRREMHAGFWYENLKERNHMEDTGVDNIKMDL